MTDPKLDQLCINPIRFLAPAGVLYEKFGLTAQRMADEAEILVKRSRAEK